MHVNDTLSLPNLQAVIAKFETMYDRRAPNECWPWKRAIRKDPRKYPIIAAQYDVNRETIGNIKRRETWKHLA